VSHTTLQFTMPATRRRNTNDGVSTIGDAVIDAFASIQQWVVDASNHESPLNCVSPTRNGSRGDVFYVNDFRSTSRDFRKWRTSSEPLLTVLGEEFGRAVSGCSVRQGFGCSEVPSADDLSSQNSEEEMMRRLGSWGTFGTLASNESIETCMDDPSAMVDDDGHRIDPLLIEKARRKREQARARAEATPGVRFEYPPITSLRQCPRVDPDDLENLFFTTEELDTYESDRKSAAIVDDVEIVAVSSSASDDVPVPPSPKGPLPNEPPVSPSKSKAFGKYIPTPKSGKGVTLSDQAQGPTDRSRQNKKDKNGRRRRAPTPGPGRRQPSYDEADEGENITSPSSTASNKPLLKSVQIFLRERSVKA